MQQQISGVSVSLDSTPGVMSSEESLKEVLEVISEAARDDELLDSNLPGVLATVSVVGQRMPALFMQHVDDIETFIVKDLMARPLPQSPKSSRVSSLAQMQSSGLKALAIGCTRSQDKSQAATRSAYTKRVVEMLRSILLVDANDMERFGSAADRGLRAGSCRDRAVIH